MARVLDEAAAEVVGICNGILQAGVGGGEQYQSPTQLFTLWACVNKVPMHICTNDWSTQETSSVDASLQMWIQEKSVHVRVTDYLCQRPLQCFLACGCAGCWYIVALNACGAVSYSHLTLPMIYHVEISVVAGS